MEGGGGMDGWAEDAGNVEGLGRIGMGWTRMEWNWVGVRRTVMGMGFGMDGNAVVPLCGLVKQERWWFSDVRRLKSALRLGCHQGTNQLTKVLSSQVKSGAVRWWLCTCSALHMAE